MSDDYTATVRIARPARIQTDDRDGSAGTEPVESAEFELLSTAELRKILESNDVAARQGIEAAAESNDQGVLARDTSTGLFEILSDEELQGILDSDFSLPRKAKRDDDSDGPASGGEVSLDDLSLVSTQALKTILRNEENAGDDDGFDPYNRR